MRQNGEENIPFQNETENFDEAQYLCCESREHDIPENTDNAFMLVQNMKLMDKFE